MENPILHENEMGNLTENDSKSLNLIVSLWYNDTKHVMLDLYNEYWKRIFHFK